MEKPYEAFNGDKFLDKEFQRLIEEFGVQTLIETGTYLGQTTSRLSELCNKVETIEIREDFYLQAQKNLKNIGNVNMRLGDAPAILDQILPKVYQPIGVFLDSHWSYPTPLKGEFEVIAKHGKPAFICIHDMKNPNDPTMGYDSYKDQEYTFEAIKPYIDLVYGEGGYNYHFNTEAEGARRGALFITMK